MTGVYVLTILIVILLLYFGIITSGSKVLITPKYFTAENIPENAYVKIINAKPISSNQVTICFWIMSDYEQVK